MLKDPYSLSTYHYDLPKELIAQYPSTPRDQSRLMVVERSSGCISEMKFRDLQTFLQTGDRLIFNNTKVFPSRLLGKRLSGGKTEIFLVKKQPSQNKETWEVLSCPAKKLSIGAQVYFSETFFCEIVEQLANGNKVVEFHYEGSFDEKLSQYGQMPLPHYIRRQVEDSRDKERYQTVYATQPGSLAAPTAGLHFTTDLLNSLSQKGVEQQQITLHVGLGTFQPVRVEDIRLHTMHAENVLISDEVAAQLNKQKLDKREICVGTTCCRALESAASNEGFIIPGEYSTNMFIYPSYQFKFVRHLLTNFHLPCSSLLMLVSAFAGYELTMEAYTIAVKNRYRFFSYGDAMLIL